MPPLELVNELERARDDVLACREETLWAQLFPHEALQVPPAATIAGGRREPIEKALPNYRQPLHPGRVFALLRADVHYLATASAEQRAALAGRDPRRDSSSVWSETPEGVDRANAERQAVLAPASESMS